MTRQHQLAYLRSRHLSADLLPASGCAAWECWERSARTPIIKRGGWCKCGDHTDDLRIRQHVLAREECGVAAGGGLSTRSDSSEQAMVAGAPRHKRWERIECTHTHHQARWPQVW